MNAVVIVMLIFSPHQLISGNDIQMIKERTTIRQLYEKFKQEYNKSFMEDEDQRKFEIFKENLKRAKMYQQVELGTAKYGITQFFDLTAEEFRQYYLTATFPKSINPNERTQIPNAGQLPDYFDWREYGAVGPVLNQGRCGACWAFSAIQNIGGQWFMKIRQYLRLSVQELVDCDFRDHGCNGGYPAIAYNVIQRLGGLELAADYPYVGYKQVCQIDVRRFVAFINGSILLPKDENQIADYLCRYGPLSLGLNSGPLQYYISGILYLSSAYCYPLDINHAVLSVGLGTDDNTPFWIMKNSWGPRWGEEGYFRIYRGADTCGVSQMVSSAIVN